MGGPSQSVFLKRIRSWLPPRNRDAHKNDFGHVLVIGGCRGMMGAPRLAALGALRGGAGLVTLGVPESLEPLAAVGPWEAMTLPLPDRSGGLTARAISRVHSYVKERRVSSVALGPGLGGEKGVVAFVQNFLSSVSVPTVLDADGLNALSLRAPSSDTPPLLLTPHPGELARLLGVSTGTVQKDRSSSARAVALRYGSVVVLKGHGTVVTDGNQTYVNSTGNPGMATGGTGDVLAGLIAALLGQVSAEDVSQRLWRAAVLGVYLHGRAGDLAEKEIGSVSLLARDVLSYLPKAIQGFSSIHPA
ncbi:MAG: NAD(P)H-hydrate dehydratase [Elusimicrobia bacterium]|nr:NAD(P)H-hydrate dehydratase [Elusimicrobiota bacterium]